MASVKAQIYEMHMVQAMDRVIDAWLAAEAAPWWDPLLRAMRARRARAAAREVEIWWERLRREEASTR